MKILFLSKFYWPHIGGVEKHIEELSRVLTKRKNKIIVITEKFDQRLKNQEEKTGIKIIRFSYPKIKYIGLIYSWIWFLKNINLIKEADIVHCHDVFIWYLPFRILFNKKPIYITFHGYESFPIKLSEKIIRKISEKLSWGNICIGDFIKKWYGTKPTIVTYGAVNINKFKDINSEKEYDAIFIGRLDKNTSFKEYLRTVNIIKKKIPNFKFIVLGDGKYKKLIDEKIIYKGSVKNPEKYLNKTKFAFVSGYLTILEAFANKKLVFSLFNNTLHRDYLKLTPFSQWLIIEKSSSNLAKKVLYYLEENSSKEKKIIKRSFNWVKNQTWEKMANQYQKLWRI